jgi:hypothetical protein
MREFDAGHAPPFPDAAVLAQRQPLVAGNRIAAALPKVAAALVLVVGAGLLTLDTSPRDPGILYADIMGDSQLMTDSLLSASPGMLPEMVEPTDAFDMELSLGEVY